VRGEAGMSPVFALAYCLQVADADKVSDTLSKVGCCLACLLGGPDFVCLFGRAACVLHGCMDVLLSETLSTLDSKPFSFSKFSLRSTRTRTTPSMRYAAASSLLNLGFSFLLTSCSFPRGIYACAHGSARDPDLCVGE
jgi:hypothetical protein